MGCGNSSSNTADSGNLWVELKKRLPLDRTPEDQEKRTALFKKFDEKKKNTLSEPECLAGCQKHLELQKLTKDLPAINIRAFQAASGLRTKADATTGVDPAEFRLYLKYLRDYFELYYMFDEVDTSDDKIVTLDEFKKALPRIEKWGVKVANPEAEFKQVDKDGKGVNFNEFADWAIKKNLDADREQAKVAPAAAAPAAASKDAGAAAAAAPAAPPAQQQEKSAEKAAVAETAAAKVESNVNKVGDDSKAEEEKAAAAALAAKEAEDKAAADKAAADKAAADKAAADKAAADKAAAEKAAADAATAADAEKAAADKAAADKAAADKAAADKAAADAAAAAGAEKAAEESAAQKRRRLLDDVEARLPRKKTPEENEKRNAVFKQFDPNGNGYLSLAEIHHGCKQVLHLDDFTDDLEPILMRAYDAARNLRAGSGNDAEAQNAYVERVEFRKLLVFIYDYFELWVMFDEIDSSDDMKITIEEFKKAVPKIESWGVKVADPEATFKEIDANGGGSILFQEFAEWAIRKHLDADGDDNIN